ncbi:NADPH-dependent FMN reductase [Aequorivita antarctica]|uniref:NAD(P)H-dependent oxidoreductase n=1 Tax=Aequorivita antarctica TaxID=153266 RepID=A0A5C6Z3R0_9FLAO|nr:NAD(P)H-dependent oxidoreductase [Aequorivita antarctica]TXD74163.1 NAD(P)H-dependent oxidoreductase [Aequorivita antarctica]SRX75984.1 Chromate reductase [Aequorivita antarctica]
MKKILFLAGSNSSKSINYKLIVFTASQFAEQTVQIIKLTDFDLPMFGEDIEREKGYSVDLKMLYNKIKDAEALVISVNEHNGTVSAYFKNTIDWLSRLDRNFLEDKKVLLMSTSNGKRGAASALEYTKNVLPRFGATVVESFSFPSFSENFSEETQSISNEILLLGFTDVLQNFMHQIEQ